MDDRDITAEQLLELLADDEMIESGYDRAGMVALLLLARAALQVQARELAELRAEFEDRYTIEPRWEDPDAPDDGRLRPDYYRLVDPNGNDVDIEVDGSELVEWVADRATRRQAAAAIRRHELSDPLGPELGAVLALVPADLDLIVTSVSTGFTAGWWADPETDAGKISRGPTREAAILATTAKLLGLDEDGLRRRVAEETVSDAGQGRGKWDSARAAAVVKAAMAAADEWKVVDKWPPYGAGRRTASRALIDAVEQLRGATAEPVKECRACSRWRPVWRCGCLGEGCELCDGLESAKRYGATTGVIDESKRGVVKLGGCAVGQDLRTGESCCPDDYEALDADTDRPPDSPPLPKGVEISGNVVSSKGDTDDA